MDDSEAFDPPPGEAEELGGDIRRILAPNPSPMTYRGTNTYLLGHRGLAVIDPGPDDPAHLDAILRAVRPGQRISHILVTHSHVDHSPLARRLKAATRAPVLAFGPSGSGRSAAMRALAAAGLQESGEGIDEAFAPDQSLPDAARIDGDDWSVVAHWTPGHLGNHMCFAYEDQIFTGDLVMGWASSLVSPPDGDLTDFMTSCRKLRQIGARRFLPGHGAAINDPGARLDWLIGHRENREAAILQELAGGAATAPEIARAIYTDTPETLLPAAVRNVLAHLIDLHGRNIVAPEHLPDQHARFALTRSWP